MFGRGRAKRADAAEEASAEATTQDVVDALAQGRDRGQADAAAATLGARGGPRRLTWPAWKLALSRTIREFSRDKATDLAAGLTYYSVLALFPGLLAIVSLLGLVGQADETTDAAFDLIGELGGEDVIESVRGPIEGLTASSASAWTFTVGLVGALWSASGYVGAFSRSMNRILGVEEGRAIWKLRPWLLLVTVVIVLLATSAGLLLVISGPIASTIGSFVGLSETAVAIWNAVQLPALALITVIAIAILYYATPNVRQRFRILSVGAFLAIVVWGLASFGFGIYVSNFANYDATYGVLGGVIVFLLWMWISNLAVLVGAELDTELERARELQMGVEAEVAVQLPLRDRSGIEKQAQKVRDDVARAIEFRLESAQSAKVARRRAELAEQEREQQQKEQAKR
ncbi:YihY/virulence factor BrkB family protein [Agromyces mangrovi Wang et al. 2018]|uniref:YihY/virulence factor BrkB family protein n=1 Tax=Agromyces mangrovi TaxID=1858653 RepID=UPI002572AE82|nr:YihY/virulence factor BrkB family protein [Agromyces mangrovi]BDZ64238.1 ribonuclease [Agromyces mangrovi]